MVDTMPMYYRRFRGGLGARGSGTCERSRGLASVLGDLRAFTGKVHHVMLQH